MYFKLQGILAALVIAAPPAWAQASCDDGQVINPDTGNCELPGDGGGGSDPDNGGDNDDLVPKLLRFLTPDAGDSFAAGTEVAPTGRTSLTNVQKLPLDLTVVIDTSASMSQSTGLVDPSTADPNDSLSRLDLVKAGVDSLLTSLADSAAVTVVTFDRFAASRTEKMSDANFDGVVDQGAGQSRQQIKDYVSGLEATGDRTNYDVAFTETLNRYNGDAGAGIELTDFDKELLFLSDGQPTGGNYFPQFNALRFRGVDPIIASLPGNSPLGNNRLQELATLSQGQFLDFSNDPLGLQAAFNDPSTFLFGITSLEITNPDGTSYFAETDAFGNFTLDPFALTEGDNVFSATAFFEDDSSFTDTLTLVGTATDMAPVPLPASGWLMLGVLAGAAAWGRKRKA